jgi:hypothetical protein
LAPSGFYAIVAKQQWISIFALMIDHAEHSCQEIFWSWQVFSTQTTVGSKGANLELIGLSN